MMTSSNFIAVMAGFLAVASFVAAVSAQPQPPQTLQKIAIIRLDPRFDKLVPPNVNVERIVSGRKWVEGPVWNRKEGYLLFSDIPANSVIKWQERKGTSVFLTPSGYSGKEPFEGAEPGSNGLAFDPEDRLVLAEHGDRRIARLDKSGKLTAIVSKVNESTVPTMSCSVPTVIYILPIRHLVCLNLSTISEKNCRSRAFTNIPKTASSRCSPKTSKRPMESLSLPTRKSSISATPIPEMRCGWFSTSMPTAASEMAECYSMPLNGLKPSRAFPME